MAELIIEIDRETRDLLRRQVVVEAQGCADFPLVVEKGDRDSGLEFRECFDLVVDVLESIGWASGPSLPDATFQLKVTEAVGKWLINLRHEIAGELGEHVVTLGLQERGESGQYWASEGQVASIARTRELIERGREDVERVAALIRQTWDARRAAVA